MSRIFMSRFFLTCIFMSRIFTTCIFDGAEISFLAFSLGPSGPGAVATEVEARKQSKHSSLAAMHHFVPVAVETLGALGEKVVQIISDLGLRIAATTAEPRSVTETCAPSAKLDDIF